ncbi:MAG: glycosyltransferase family 2 protein [Candidatus Obscuribacterales bacterium]|nr:glycosyltransferase family 2 protein [Steroidobacteraceae bacterium]
MKPLVSVIIPTFNRALLVQQAVESVLQQRGDFQFEIVVVDDGSTPETEQALKRFGNAIRYVRQDNAGLNPARNHGLRLVSGEYIALLDDDDVWLPFKTALLLAAINKFPHAGFVHSNFFIWKPERDLRRADGLSSWFPRPFCWDDMYEHRVDMALAEVETLGFDQATFTVYSGDLYYWSLFAPMVLPSTAIIRRSALGADVEFPRENTIGDWEFFARLSHRCGAVFVPNETTLNRSHEDAVRLTRADPSVQLRRRLVMIQRLWRKDPTFMQSNASEVDRVEAEWLRSLVKHSISSGNSVAAKESLRALRRLKVPLTVNEALLWGMSYVPFTSKAVAILRSLRKHARSASGTES